MVIDSKEYSIYKIRYQADIIKQGVGHPVATLSDYDYLRCLANRMDRITKWIKTHDGYNCTLDEQGSFVNTPTANIVANSIHSAMVALIPSFGLGDFDWAGAGEDLNHLVTKSYDILQECDEDGLAQGVCDRHNLFVTMCELQEKLDEQALTDLAND